jgi:hypothetical protein
LKAWSAYDELVRKLSSNENQKEKQHFLRSAIIPTEAYNVVSRGSESMIDDNSTVVIQSDIQPHAKSLAKMETTRSRVYDRLSSFLGERLGADEAVLFGSDAALFAFAGVAPFDFDSSFRGFFFSWLVGLAESLFAG